MGRLRAHRRGAPGPTREARLSGTWSVAAGNDGHAALFVHAGEPSARLAQRLAAEVDAPVVLLSFDDDLYYVSQIRDDGSEHRLAEKPAAALAAHGIAVPASIPRSRRRSRRQRRVAARDRSVEEAPAQSCVSS